MAISFKESCHLYSYFYEQIFQELNIVTIRYFW